MELDWDIDEVGMICDVPVPHQASLTFNGSSPHSPASTFDDGSAPSSTATLDSTQRWGETTRPGTPVAGRNAPQSKRAAFHDYLHGAASQVTSKPSTSCASIADDSPRSGGTASDVHDVPSLLTDATISPLSDTATSPLSDASTSPLPGAGKNVLPGEALRTIAGMAAGAMPDMATSPVSRASSPALGACESETGPTKLRRRISQGLSGVTPERARGLGRRISGIGRAFRRTEP